MSILFYRRPDYTTNSAAPLNASECQRYVERARNCERAIPPGLSFEDVIENRSLPPCSLADFMDFLVYVEHNAENLQFYLWYKDYVHRFEALPEKDRALAPEWTPETAEPSNLGKDTEKNDLKKRATATDTLELSNHNDMAFFKPDQKEAESLQHTFSGRLDSDLESTPATPSLLSETRGLGEAYSQEGLGQSSIRWEPFTVQPMREEINRVMRHYLVFNAPRELNLSHKDRTLCLHALQHTTHPSAFLPALKITNAALRGQSHPNFIRWSICNGNRPRVFFVRTMGISNTLLGFLIAVLLTLSKASRWWRIFAGFQWFLGITTLVAAYKGLCVILHSTHARNLRPWEQLYDTEIDEERRSSFSSTAQRRIQMATRVGDFDETTAKDDGRSFRSQSMQSFGPKNSFENEEWIEHYSKKPLIRKVFDKTTWTQDETLRLLQDRIVLGAISWSLMFTIPLTVIFVALPKGNYY
ncbi:hypothetical protein ACMFMG_005820 [Clarireedia jacksonii]